MVRLGLSDEKMFASKKYTNEGNEMRSVRTSFKVAETLSSTEEIAMKNFSRKWLKAVKNLQKWM